MTITVCLHIQHIVLNFKAIEISHAAMYFMISHIDRICKKGSYTHIRFCNVDDT